MECLPVTFNETLGRFENQSDLHGIGIEVMNLASGAQHRSFCADRFINLDLNVNQPASQQKSKSWWRRAAASPPPPPSTNSEVNLVELDHSLQPFGSQRAQSRVATAHSHCVGRKTLDESRRHSQDSENLAARSQLSNSVLRIIMRVSLDEPRKYALPGLSAFIRMSGIKAVYQGEKL